MSAPPHDRLHALDELEHPQWVYLLWAAIYPLVVGAGVARLIWPPASAGKYILDVLAVFALLCAVASLVTACGLLLAHGYSLRRAAATAAAMPFRSVTTVLELLWP